MSALNSEQIEARSAEIFAEGTFDGEHIRGAAYDLRIQREGGDQACRGDLASMLRLSKGERAIVETYECLTIPWDLTGNIGVKAQLALQGLFVTQGLFVDPGFGWVKSGPDACKPQGARLRFMLTNMGNDAIEIQLGEKGDPVMGIQFLQLSRPAPEQPIPHRDARPQALAVFSDIASLKKKVKRLDRDVIEVQSATSQVVLFGVFLVAATIFGAAIAAILAIASGDGSKRAIHAINGLNTSRTGPVVFLLATVVVSLACVVFLAKAVCSVFGRAFKRR